MATMNATVVSNSPEVTDPGSVADLITEYSFDGVTLRVNGDGTTDRLDLYGHNHVGLRICPRRPDGEVIPDEDATEDFFEALAPHLAEPLVVQVVGSVKCRFPALGRQFTVTPNGDVLTNGFAPDKIGPEAAPVAVDPAYLILLEEDAGVTVDTSGDQKSPTTIAASDIEYAQRGPTGDIVTVHAGEPVRLPAEAISYVVEITGSGLLNLRPKTLGEVLGAGHTETRAGGESGV